MNSILNIDESILRGANGVVGRWGWLDAVILLPAVYLVYLAPIILLALWFYSKRSRKAALQALGSGLLAWLVLSRLISRYVWYRPRPNATSDIKELIFHRPDYSFPSDHMSLLVAVTASVWLLGYRKLGFWLAVVSVAVGAGRVMIGVHYPLDILAGAAVGLIAAMVARWLDRPLTKYVYNPIIRVAQKIHLP